MQTVPQEWQEIQRMRFTTETSMAISIEKAGEITAMIGSYALISLSHTKSGDILSGCLPQDKIVLVADSTLDLFQNIEPDRFKNAKISITEGFHKLYDKGYIGINGGSYFITDVSKDVSGRKVSISASTILSFMTQKIDEDMTGNAYAVATQLIIMASLDKGVPSNSIGLRCDPDAIRSVQINILQTDGFSIAEGLQLIANACGCVLFADRGNNIHIEPYAAEGTSFVLSNKTLYSPVSVSYSDLIGNVTIISGHGANKEWTDFEGEKIGGEQIVTNPVLAGDGAHTELLFHIYQTLNAGRKKFRGSCRFDPALDLFDTIMIPNGNSVDVAVITGISATYNGAWKADIQAVKIKGSVPKLRICDIEMLTINQLESLTIGQVSPDQ